MTEKLQEPVKVLFFTSINDPEVHTWPLTNPVLALAIVSVYLALVLYILPAFMKNRPAFKLRNVIICYNIMHVLNSLFLMYRAARPGIPFMDLFSPVCHHQVNATREHKLDVTGAMWWFVLEKILELPDTIFFVLRKKYKQVSFLHVYHHASTFVLMWCFLKFATEDNVLLEIFLNSFIHVLMYGYYAVAAMGPEYQKYIWWKKYMTSMQLIQFFMMLAYLIWGMYFSNCSYTFLPSNTMILDLFLMVYLFSKFYKQQYTAPKKTK